MRYTVKQIKGKGRGKLLGYPTINFEIPIDLIIDEGIYAGWVWIGKIKYKGAFHYGPIPTFNEGSKSLEAFLIDTDETKLKNPEQKSVKVELVKKIRDIVKFTTTQELSKQITQDVEDINGILS